MSRLNPWTVAVRFDDDPEVSPTAPFTAPLLTYLGSKVLADGGRRGVVVAFLNYAHADRAIDALI